MYKQRYFIVEYSQTQEDNFGRSEDGLFINHFPLHNLLGGYHWSRLDADHVLCVGTFAISREKHIHAHGDKVTMLPHLASIKPLHKIAKKQAHWHSLRKSLNIPDEPSTLSDLVEHMEHIHGPVFGALR